MELKDRQERLVFVDPEDEEISYWWPAIVVPEEEYELFKETMDNDAGVNVGEHERLVCYFEDGSFSVVPKSGLIPFNPQKEPYKSYSRRLKHFLTDAGVRRATEFHNSGKIPKMFKWLILAETGYLDPTEESDGEEMMTTEEEFVNDIEDQHSDRTTKKVKIFKEVKEISSVANTTSTSTKTTTKTSTMTTTISSSSSSSAATAAAVAGVIKNKRGRKPKNQVETSLVSPKPMNPSAMMKIEALISSKMSSESISKESTIITETI